MKKYYFVRKGIKHGPYDNVTEANKGAVAHLIFRLEEEVSNHLDHLETKPSNKAEVVEQLIEARTNITYLENELHIMDLFYDYGYSYASENILWK